MDALSSFINQFSSLSSLLLQHTVCTSASLIVASQLCCVGSLGREGPCLVPPAVEEEGLSLDIYSVNYCYFLLLKINYCLS